MAGSRSPTARRSSSREPMPSLRVGAAEVVLDRPDGEEQRLRDVTVAHPICGHAYDPRLTGRQCVGTGDHSPAGPSAGDPEFFDRPSRQPLDAALLSKVESLPQRPARPDALVSCATPPKLDQGARAFQTQVRVVEHAQRFAEQLDGPLATLDEAGGAQRRASQAWQAEIEHRPAPMPRVRALPAASRRSSASSDLQGPMIGLRSRSLVKVSPADRRSAIKTSRSPRRPCEVGRGTDHHAEIDSANAGSSWIDSASALASSKSGRSSRTSTPGTLSGTRMGCAPPTGRSRPGGDLPLDLYALGWHRSRRGRSTRRRTPTPRPRLRASKYVGDHPVGGVELVASH